MKWFTKNDKNQEMVEMTEKIEKIENPTGPSVPEDLVAENVKPVETKTETSSPSALREGYFGSSTDEEIRKSFLYIRDLETAVRKFVRDATGEEIDDVTALNLAQIVRDIRAEYKKSK